MTRCGVPRTITPVQFAMGILEDQFSVPLPARVSRTVSRISQSDSKPGLVAALGTAPSVEQGGPDCNGVPVRVADHGPSPAALIARTCTSYRVPSARPVSVWLTLPDPVQAPLATVQFPSALLGISLRMLLNCQAESGDPPSLVGGFQTTVSEPSPGLTDTKMGAPGGYQRRNRRSGSR